MVQGEYTMKKTITLFIFSALFLLAQSCYGSENIASLTSQSHIQDIQRGLDVMLVLDNSGSMKKSDPDFIAGDVVAESLLSLGKDSRVGMVIFDSKPRLAVELISTDNIVTRANILSGLDEVDYKGQFSNTPAAIETAMYELKNNGRKGARKIIILMTDGFLDTGDKQQDIEAWSWLKEDLTEESRKYGIRIFGIAFSDIADFSMFQILATRTDGEYFRAYGNGNIKEIFGQIMEIIPEPSLQQAPLTSSATVTEEQTLPATGITPPQPSDQATETEGPPQKGAGMDREDMIPWGKVLVGVLVLLVIVAGAVVYYKMSINIPKKARELKTPSGPFTPRAVLIDLNNITGTSTFSLDKQISLIGRDPNNDVVIPKNTISSFHAVIEYKDGFFYLEDQRSMNKTILAGEDLKPHLPRRLKSGDEIQFHLYRFKFIIPDTIPSGKTMIDFHAPTESFGKQQETAIKELPPLPQAIMVDVENITGKKTMRLKKVINRIGRGAGNDIDISQRSISGLHATIEYRNGFFYLEDQRSKNKTSLGGVEIHPHVPTKLKSGDEIIFDIYKFIFLLEYEPPSGDTGEGKGAEK
jgi:pSer/pThr/pTyr-binding forkhead associated (FHA) protein/Mg-chelatase subunit ChlD